MAEKEDRAGGDELNQSEINWGALDKANDQVGAAGPDGLGPLEARAALMAEIIGGRAGKRALLAFPKKPKPKG